MIIFAFAIGMILPTLIGWLLVRLLERDTLVLYTMERWAVAHVIGITMTMFLFFLAEVSGFLQFTATNFLLICTVVLIGLGTLFMRLRLQWSTQPVELPSSQKLSKFTRIILIIFAIWTTVKILSAAVILVGSPPYLDDVFNNWNMRGKMYYETQQLELTMEIGNDITSNSGVSSYPPTVPLVKTWLATLAGEWNEGLVKGPHIVWYICALLLVFFFLRRHTNFVWSVVGAYGLSSIPIYLVHGAHAYADVFVSVHVFIVVSALFNALQAKKDTQSLTWLRLAGIAAAALIFTKNEALLLHLPACVLLFVFALHSLKKNEVLSAKECHAAVIQNCILLACTLVPWMIFKWMNDLPFGNAKAISGTTFAWQEGALKAIWINTFFEGNWILLFPLLFLLLAKYWRKEFSTPVVIFTAYFILLLGAQLPIYLFTGLSTEAILQTGLARGFVQLVPIMIALVVLLLDGNCKMHNA